MKMFKLTALALAGTLLAVPAFAVDEHHPEKQAQATQDAAGAPGMGQQGSEQQGMMMDMSQMQDMMKQMHGAKTPEERQKLRSEHREAMQSKMGEMRERLQQSQCPMAKDDAAQQQCMRDMHGNMQDMMQMMEQMLQQQSAQDAQ